MTNIGNVTMTAPMTVTDDRATVTCPTTLLAPGQSLTCTATYVITQDDLNAGAVINTATATSGTTTSPPDSATAVAGPAPQLALEKTASPLFYDHVGEEITYIYEITNDSEATLNGPFSVVDDRVTTATDRATGPGTPDVPDPLPRGTSVTCKASYFITQEDLDAGSVTNHAIASAFFGVERVVSNPDQATVEAIKSPALSVVKTVDPLSFDEVGDVLSYEYLVTNEGNVTLTEPVTVTDDKTTVTCPRNLRYPWRTCSSHRASPLLCLATYTITEEDLEAGAVINVASASSGTTNSLVDLAAAVADPVATARPGEVGGTGDL